MQMNFMGKFSRTGRKKKKRGIIFLLVVSILSKV